MTSVNGHMTKIATCSFKVKTLSYVSHWNQKANGLWTWYVTLGMWSTNYEYGLTMTFFTARPNLIPNAFILEKSLDIHFSIIAV